MNERLKEYLISRKNGITIVKEPVADCIQGEHEITFLWRQLLWEFTNGADLKKNMIRTMECFGVIKISVVDCFVISPDNQRVIRRIIGQMAKRSHVILIIPPGVSIGKDYGEQIPLLDKLHADTLCETVC